MLGAALAFGTLVLFGNSTSFAATSDQTDLLNRATTTALHMKQDPAFGAARNMLANAKGVLIVPSLVKGGFIFGAEGGSGVLSVKNWRQLERTCLLYSLIRLVRLADRTRESRSRHAAYER